MRPLGLSLPFKHMLLGGFLVAACAGSATAGGRLIAYTERYDKADIIVDIRASEVCESASLPDARCLDAGDFFGPHKRLANFSGVLWLLGAAGLRGDEHVVVAGGDATDREAMAGLLLLAGQRQISIDTKDIESQPAAGSTAGKLAPGTARSQTRETIYQAAMRANRITLRINLLDEIRSDRPPAIFDGRSEPEYWGERIRAARGGHVPGAEHRPIAASATNSPSTAPKQRGDLPIAYAHNAREGLAYLARLEAAGVAARIYLEGWAGWASDGALPADSVTHPDRNTGLNAIRRTRDSANGSGTSLNLSGRQIAGFGAAGLVLAIAGFFLGRLTSNGPGSHAGGSAD